MRPRRFPAAVNSAQKSALYFVTQGGTDGGENSAGCRPVTLAVVASARICCASTAARSIHSTQKSALYFVTQGGAPNTNIGKPVLWAVVPFLCTPHKNPSKISSRGKAGRGGICVRPALSSRKTLTRICSVFYIFLPLFALYPPFLFRQMPSEKGSRTGAGVRLRVHHVCRCGIHGRGGHQC